MDRNIQRWEALGKKRGTRRGQLREYYSRGGKTPALKAEQVLMVADATKIEFGFQVTVNVTANAQAQASAEAKCSHKETADVHARATANASGTASAAASAMVLVSAKTEAKAKAKAEGSNVALELMQRLTLKAKADAEANAKATAKATAKASVRCTWRPTPPTETVDHPPVVEINGVTAHVYPGEDMDVYVEGWDPDGDALTAPVISLTGLSHYSGLKVMGTRYDGSPIPAGHKVWRITIWALTTPPAGGLATVTATVSSTGSSGKSLTSEPATVTIATPPEDRG